MLLKLIMIARVNKGTCCEKLAYWKMWLSSKEHSADEKLQRVVSGSSVEITEKKHRTSHELQNSLLRKCEFKLQKSLHDINPIYKNILVFEE